jgi:hypothetical protein
VGIGLGAPDGSRNPTAKSEIEALTDEILTWMA